MQMRRDSTDSAKNIKENFKKMSIIFSPNISEGCRPLQERTFYFSLHGLDITIIKIGQIFRNIKFGIKYIKL
jgi:hypothetical protein